MKRKRGRPKAVGTVVTWVRIPKGVRDVLADYARARREPISCIIREIVERWLVNTRT